MKIRNTICTRCNQLRKVIDGEELKAMRLVRGLSLREVARQVGISPAYLCDIEHNRRLSPRGLVNYWKRKELSNA